MVSHNYYWEWEEISESCICSVFDIAVLPNCTACGVDQTVLDRVIQEINKCDV